VGAELKSFRDEINRHARGVCAHVAWWDSSHSRGSGPRAEGSSRGTGYPGAVRRGERRVVNRDERKGSAQVPKMAKRNSSTRRVAPSSVRAQCYRGWRAALPVQCSREAGEEARMHAAKGRQTGKGIGAGSTRRAQHQQQSGRGQEVGWQG
jgi:hypothetical protein